MGIQLLIKNQLGLLLDDSIEINITNRTSFEQMKTTTQRVLSGYGYPVSRIISMFESEDDGELDEIPANCISHDALVANYSKAVVFLPLSS